MKVLVVGNGGREHAIAWKLQQSPLLTELFCIPGNAGTAQVATNVTLGENSPQQIAQWAIDNKIDFTVVGPEAWLAAGIVNEFDARGLKIFGPTKEAAQLESSKAFSKEIMVAAGVPTAEARTFSDFEAAREYVTQKGAPIVIKADGLAAGKGVVVAMQLEEAIAALEDCLLDNKLGASGALVVVEEFLLGREASAIAIVDGEVVKPFVLSQDYKRQCDGDVGPNTGGMGAISPTDVFPESKMGELVETIFLPTIRELKRRGISYRGFLYAGILVRAKDNKPHVIEFNCRLGDPETQVLLPRLESDLLAVLLSAVDGKLADVEMAFTSKAAATVVMASAGYPVAVDDGKEISGLFAPQENRIVFHAGTVAKDGKVISKGGRILAVTGLAEDLPGALKEAYQGVSEISFAGVQYRKDIGGSKNE